MAYIGTIPAEAYTSFAVQHFTTSATDTFTLDFPVANENEIALFINNVRQEPGSSYAYTASGTTLTLSSAITGSDSMYCVFIGKAVQTVTPAVGSVTNDMIAYPLAKSGATVSTFNRTSSDGNIVELQKDGTTVGSIAVKNANNLQIRSTSSGHSGIEFGTNTILPADASGALTNNQIDFGSSSNTFKDLYLGGNIYLGGTGGSNALDDYEEGTWTPELKGDNWTGSLNYTQQQGIYIKVGRLVFVSVFLAWNANNFSAGSNRLDLQGLPFATSNQSNYRGGITIGYASNAWTGLTIYQQAFRVESSASKFGFNFSDATDGHITTEISSHTNIQSSGSFMMGGTYATD